MPEGPFYADVAVPVPIDATFTYAVPDSIEEGVRVGSRVRVPFGSRILTGIVLGRPTEPPVGVDVRPISALLDDEPAVPEAILAASRFVAEYYLAPIGEVLRSALPAVLSRSGERRYSVTEKGVASMPALPDGEREVVDLVLARGRATAGDIREELRRPGLAAVLESLSERGVLSAEDRFTDRKGIRWDKGLALRELPAAEIEAAIGRSAVRRHAVELLRIAGRPMLLSELSEAGVSAAVAKALLNAGIASAFTQPRRYSASDRWHSGEATIPPTHLTGEQESALAEIRTRPGGAFLVEGVTGSGKSELYARTLEDVVSAGRKGIWLVPEIALTPVFARQLAARFGGRLAVLHSAMSSGERSTEWRRIREGEVDVVLGPRSAIFAPALPLGAIVVDEEHEGSYKQEETPRYHARDLALWRGAREGATVLLGSATPSLESFHGATTGRLGRVRLRSRVSDRPLPGVELVDLRKEAADPGDKGAVIFSTRLRAEIERCLGAGEQAILLLNRRGYSPHLVCRSCSEDFHCGDCSVARTFHKRDRRLACHYCGRSIPAPSKCPKCGSELLHPEGVGTERVVEKLAELWPDVPADRLDRDVVRRKGGAAAILDRFARGDLRLLVGTQMVAKGHHFPNVTLTGVVSADGQLGFPDFRAGERTFQLLVQVSGRAGRGERPGNVVIQTFYPEHPAIRHAVSGTHEAFYEEEMRLRKAFGFPPYTRMVRILCSSANRGAADREIRAIGEAIGRRKTGDQRMLGPAPAPLERLLGRFRFHLLLRGTSRPALRTVVASALSEVAADSKVDRIVDVDPAHVM